MSKFRTLSVFQYILVPVFLAITLALTSCSRTESPGFTKIEYQNPELEVDLGVGLWAWPLPMDYDEDGDMDLVVACPDVPSNGLYYFENKDRSHPQLPVFEPSIKIGEGDKNFQLSIVDGKPRVMVPGIEYTNFRSFQLNNPEQIYPARQLERMHQKIRFSQWRYVDYEGDGDLDLLVGMDDWDDYGWDNAFDARGRWINGPLHGFVYLLENDLGRYQTVRKLDAGSEPIDVYGAPSPNMYDFDGDGDLDLICGEFLDRLTWFENIGTRTSPSFSTGRFLENTAGIIHMDLEMIIPTAIDWDADGDVDLIVGDEDGRVALLENSGVVKNHMPIFENPVYLKQKAKEVKFGALVTPYSTDWDEDGDEDLICGNTAGYIGFIENLDGGNPPKWAAPKYLEVEGEAFRIMAGDSGSIQGPAEKKWGYTTLSVADWDGDGLKDILFNSIWGKINWLRNIGAKGQPKLARSLPVQVAWDVDPIPKPSWTWWDPQPEELATQWRTTPQAIDWNKDGLMDLVMLDHEGYLSYYQRFNDNGALKLKPGSRIFYGEGGSQFDRSNNEGTKTEGPLRLNTGVNGQSGRRKWCFVDWDVDGDLDILINSKNAALFENKGERNGKVHMSFEGDLSNEQLAGHTTSPTIVDWDQNGRPDLLLGAEDGYLYYLQNQK